MAEVPLCCWVLAHSVVRSRRRVSREFSELGRFPSVTAVTNTQLAAARPVSDVSGAAMAPTEPILLEWQTGQIIRYLLKDEDDGDGQCRMFSPGVVLQGEVEADSPFGASNDDTFDPVLIADKLKSVADAMNEDAQFKAALTEMKKAATNAALEAAFSHSVEAICKNQVTQKAEVAPEMQLIKASVAFGLYVKKSCPDLKSNIQWAMTSFLNRRVGPWVTKQGGWDKVV